MGNINLPIDNTLIERVDAARGKQPRVSWIRDAITDKLATKSASPTVARVTTDQEGSEADSPHPPPRSAWSRPLRKDCAHPYRDPSNKCRLCGDQR